MRQLGGYVISPRPALSRRTVRTGVTMLTVVVRPAPAGPLLRAVRSGSTFRVVSPPARGLAVPALGVTLEAVLEQFARVHGFTQARPLTVAFSRGYEPDSPGHREGRAIDIVALDGRGFPEWKGQWDRAHVDARRLPAGEQSDAVTAERRQNLGHRLYAALLGHGGWRVDDHCWRPYRGLVQLFGPWTATEGPWPRDRPTPLQRRDRAWILRAHRDHIHVAQ